MNGNNLSTFLLPKLRTGAIDIPLGQLGKWNIYEINAFDQIASSLDVPPPNPEFKSISAIPDMWARPLMFEMALHVTTHPLQPQMTAQWQGMLAAIAFADVKGFPLQVQYLDLELESKKDSNEFASSLYKLIPRAQVGQDSRLLYSLSNDKNPWQEIYIFLWNGKSVGMTSPSTLVCPSEEADWQGLPWWDKDKKELRSPIRDLNAEEKSLLASWLNNLRTILTQERVRGSRATDPIIRLVDEFITSLGNVNVGGLSLNAQFFSVPINRGALKGIGSPLKARVIAASDSSISLVPGNGNNPNQPLLIFDPAIAELWGVQPSSVLVCGNKSLQNMTNADISNLERTHRVRIIDSEDLFLSDLHFIAQEDALPGCLFPLGADNLIFCDDEGNTNRITPLLPINPILLEFFTTSDLINNYIQVQFTPSKEVQITLNLQLSGVNGQTNYTKTRKYALRAANSLLEVPVLEVWPNFIAKFPDGRKWSEYYTFYCDPDYEDDTFSIQLPDTGLETYSFRENNISYQISKTTDFPNYVNCKSSNGKELGLLLIKPPLTVQPSVSEPWVIGVDFGTSFTNVYCRKDNATNNAASLLPLESLHLQVTESKISVRLRTLPESFVPEIFIPEEKPLPLSSILTTKNRQQINDQQVRPIFDGRIYAPLDSSSFKPESQTYVKTNLKWGTDNTFSSLFLKHLALHVSAIAVKNGATSIKWSISYPSAFSKGDRRRYVQSWKDLLGLNDANGLSQVTGITHEAPADINDTTRFRTESLAIAQYFVDKEDLNLVYTTCIDIGGGTSDISIWQENNLVHQCSVQLAGRDIFSQIIFKNSLILDDFKKYQGKSEKFTDDNRDGNSFISKLDLLMRRDGKDWINYSRSKEDNPQFVGLRRVSTIGIAGLYYYVGIILRVLHEEGLTRYPEITPVYVGGNGSRLIHWLAEGGSFDRTSELNQLLKRMLHSGSGLREANYDTHLSSSPKQEAACGLIVSGNKLQGLNNPNQDLLVAGENCEINGVNFNWNDRLRFPSNVEQIRISPRMEQLRAFLDAYHSAIDDLDLEEMRPLSRYGSDSNYTEDLWSQASRKLTATILKMKGNSDDIREEPPFILGLKALLDVLGAEWQSQR